MSQKELETQKMNWKKFVDLQHSLFDSFFYHNYFKSCGVLDVDNGQIIISVPSKYTKEILLEKEVDKKFQNNNLKVVFVIKQEWNKNQKEKKEITENNFTFANLVVGKFNKGVFDISQKILNGENIWTPFFFYSEPGLGKTHFLKAIQNEIQKKKNNCHYIHANSFSRQFFSAFKKGSLETEELKLSFDKYEIILFDDVQLLSSREKTNEVLFQIFCNVIDQKKQIIFTSDQHPEELSGFEKRLKSRFVNGLILKIDYPDYETAKEIVKKKAIEIIGKNINKINPETFAFIGKHFYKDIRKIEGIIKKINFVLLGKSNYEIGLTEFKKIFADQINQFKNRISSQTIQKQTAKFYGVSYSTMVSGTKKSKVVKSRSVAMYLIRCLTEENFVNIASRFNSKNHTTAINAVKKIKRELEISPSLQKEIKHLKEICQNE